MQIIGLPSQYLSISVPSPEYSEKILSIKIFIMRFYTTLNSNIEFVTSLYHLFNCRRIVLLWCRNLPYIKSVAVDFILKTKPKHLVLLMSDFCHTGAVPRKKPQLDRPK